MSNPAIPADYFDAFIAERLAKQQDRPPMSTEADIVERLRERSLELSGRSIDRGCQDSGISANLCDEAVDLITKLRADRDAAARDMRERCAKVALGSYSLMFPKPRNRITAENAGHAVAAAIRALPDTPAVIATEGETNG